MKTTPVMPQNTRAPRTASPSGLTRRTPGASPAKLPKTNQPEIAPKWAWHYRTLVRLRNNLLKDSAAKLQEMAEAIEPHSMHPADSGTDEFNHDLALALLTREDNALSEVNHAITRIRNGTYGICEATGANIPAPRLRALPWCRYGHAPEEQLEATGDITKFKLPAAVSIRGPQPSIPVTGNSTGDNPEDTKDEEEESDEVKLVEEIPTPTAEEIDAVPAGAAPARFNPKRAIAKRRLRQPRALPKKPDLTQERRRP